MKHVNLFIKQPTIIYIVFHICVGKSLGFASFLTIQARRRVYLKALSMYLSLSQRLGTRAGTPTVSNRGRAARRGSLYRLCKLNTDVAAIVFKLSSQFFLYFAFLQNSASSYQLYFAVLFTGVSNYIYLPNFTIIILDARQKMQMAVDYC